MIGEEVSDWFWKKNFCLSKKVVPSTSRRTAPLSCSKSGLPKSQGSEYGETSGNNSGSLWMMDS